MSYYDTNLIIARLRVVKIFTLLSFFRSALCPKKRFLNFKILKIVFLQFNHVNFLFLFFLSLRYFVSLCIMIIEHWLIFDHTNAEKLSNIFSGTRCIYFSMNRFKKRALRHWTQNRIIFQKSCKLTSQAVKKLWKSEYSRNIRLRNCSLCSKIEKNATP